MVEYLNYNKESIQNALCNFHLQIEHSLDLMRNQNEFNLSNNIDLFLICGMGGSAIGGDYFKSFVHNFNLMTKVKIEVNRYYSIPNYVNENSLIILSSYSGNTEETISAALDAIKITKNIIAITTGGKLEKIAKENHFPIIKIPEGFQPRAAIGYSIMSLFSILINSNILNNEKEIELVSNLNVLPEFIKKVNKKYSAHDFNNPAFKLANQLFDRIPLIYSSDLMQAINLRWRGQFQENSKSMAFGNIVPEMNHNEINGFFKPIGAINKLNIILLRDRENHPRVKLRFEAMKELLSDLKIEFLEYYGIGDNFLERSIDLTLLGDWTSYYLGILYKQDPNSIPFINKFKEIMNKNKS